MSRAIRGHQIGGPAAAAKLPGAIAAMAEKTAAAAGTQALFYREWFAEEMVAMAPKY